VLGLGNATSKPSLYRSLFCISQLQEERYASDFPATRRGAFDFKPLVLLNSQSIKGTVADLEQFPAGGQGTDVSFRQGQLVKAKASFAVGAGFV